MALHKILHQTPKNKKPRQTGDRAKGWEITWTPVLKQAFLFFLTVDRRPRKIILVLVRFCGSKMQDLKSVSSLASEIKLDL